MSPRPRTAIILNASSGDGSAEAAEAMLESMFTDAGHDVEITLVRSGDDIRHAVECALAVGSQCIVAGGGDGTLNGVVQHLLDHDVTLGVLPLGTLNHFAKDLGIPLAMADAARVVLDGVTVRVDVGEVNGRVFLNNSSLGMYPRIVQLRERYQARGLAKWIVATWATLRVMDASRTLRVRITIDGHAGVRHTPLVFVGNNEYRMQGFDAGSRPSLAEGQLALYVVKTEGRWHLLRLVWRILASTAQRSGELALMQAREAIIDTESVQLSVAVDGEVESIAAPLRYRIRPGALAVRVPTPEH
ncbi:MAG: diacylglycerol kinase family protein [Gemmatimonadaceae bacterium]|nr:diacylglycerol kinase family protein [Gemmatimonadaceae bacterium]